MRQLLTICVMLIVCLAICASPSYAAISYGTPSPSLSPTFGTLINFDDQATGTPVLAGDYVAQGVASIIEVTGGTLARYGGSQSMPNYIGTGSGYEIGGITSGWDGIIQIDLASPASQIGIGIADSAGADYLSVYDSEGTLLEEHLLNPGANVYAVISRDGFDISRIEIDGDFFAADDLQFNRALGVEKTLVDWMDLGDGDGDIEVGELWRFLMQITVTNHGDTSIDAIELMDRLGGDLVLVDLGYTDPYPDTYYTKGKTDKGFLGWDVGTLLPGESAIFYVDVATDTNTGTGNGRKVGHQEYTTAGKHELNSGATAKGMLGELEVSDTSDPIIVDVVEPD